MENEENKKAATQGNDHPKPTDDVQLEIETVIPSTEKPDEPAQKTEEVKDEENAKLNDQDEKADTTEKPAEENKTDNDDKRDDIETATPSA